MKEGGGRRNEGEGEERKEVGGRGAGGGGKKERGRDEILQLNFCSRKKCCILLSLECTSHPPSPTALTHTATILHV